MFGESAVHLKPAASSTQIQSNDEQERDVSLLSQGGWRVAVVLCSGSAEEVSFLSKIFYFSNFCFF